MGYIYHIFSKTEPTTMYIGQSSHEQFSVKEKSKDLTVNAESNRVLQHFSGLYDNKTESAEFNAWLKRNKLSDVRIRIYDSTVNYGIDDRFFNQFFSIWRPANQEANVHVTIDQEGLFQYESDSKNKTKIVRQNKFKHNQNFTHDKILSRYKLDVAEILHIYYYKSKGYTLLNRQMGGQQGRWVGSDGLVMNREMTIDDVYQMISSDRTIIKNIQATFEREFREEWKNKSFKLFTKPLTQYVIDNISYYANHGMKQEYVEEIKKVASQHLGNLVYTILPQIQNTLQHKGVNLTAVLTPLTQGLYKKDQNINNLFKHWNILSIIVAAVAKGIKKSLEDKKINYAKEILNIAKASQNIQRSLESQIGTIVQGISSQIRKWDISYANFFTIKFKASNDNKSTLIPKWDSLKIKNPNKTALSLYQDSFKRMSYAYFSKIARAAASEVVPNPMTRTVNLSGNDYTLHYLKTSWSYRIESILKTKADIFRNNDFCWFYVRQFLTIFAQRNTAYVPDFKSKPVFMEGDLKKYAVFNNPNDGINGEIERTGYAIPLSDATYYEIQSWIDAAVLNASYY